MSLFTTAGDALREHDRKLNRQMADFTAQANGYGSMSEWQAVANDNAARNRFGQPVAVLSMQQRRALFRDRVVQRITPLAVAALPLYVGRLDEWIATYILSDGDEALIGDIPWSTEVRMMVPDIELFFSEATLAAAAVGLGVSIVKRDQGRFAWRVAQSLSVKRWVASIVAHTIQHAVKSAALRSVVGWTGKKIAIRFGARAAGKVASWYLGPSGWIIDGVLVTWDLVDAIDIVKDTIFADREELAEALTVAIFGLTPEQKRMVDETEVIQKFNK